jgi:hypothetical protein
MVVRCRRRRAAVYGGSAATSEHELVMHDAVMPIVGVLPDTARMLVAPYPPALPPNPLRVPRPTREKGAGMASTVVASGSRVPDTERVPVAPYAPGLPPNPLRVPRPKREKGAGMASTVVASGSRADPTHERVRQTQEMRQDEKVSVSIRSAPARSGRGHDPLPYTPELHVPSTLPDGGTSPGEATSPADAIATEELLRVLDARGMLPAAQEPLPMYEEIGRRP